MHGDSAQVGVVVVVLLDELVVVLLEVVIPPLPAEAPEEVSPPAPPVLLPPSFAEPLNFEPVAQATRVKVKKASPVKSRARTPIPSFKLVTRPCSASRPTWRVRR